MASWLGVIENVALEVIVCEMLLVPDTLDVPVELDVRVSLGDDV